MLRVRIAIVLEHIITLPNPLSWGDRVHVAAYGDESENYQRNIDNTKNEVLLFEGSSLKTKFFFDLKRQEKSVSGMKSSTKVAF